LYLAGKANVVVVPRQRQPAMAQAKEWKQLVLPNYYIL